MEKFTACPSCQHKTIEVILEGKDYFLTQEPFQVNKCQNCLLVFTNPQPNIEEIAKYYQSNNYISHGAKKFSVFDKLYKLVQKFSLRWKTKIIRNLIGSTGKVLDYGCGTGDFLSTCKSIGYQINGIEPSTKAYDEASKKLGTCVKQHLESIPTSDFDIITLWHVLEHIQDFTTVLKSLKKKLQPNGYFLIAVPNHKCYDANFYKETWAALDLPRHLWHFDQTTMKNTLNMVGLEVKQTIPMLLDAYYVSILSSNYRPGLKIPKLITALTIGLLSNLRARKNTEYSSLLYIVKTN